MGKQFSLSTLPAKRGFQYLRGKPGSQEDRVGGVRAPANHLLFFPRNIFKLKPTHFLRSALFALYHHTCQQLPTSKAGSRSLLFSKIRVFKTLRPALLLPNFNPIRRKKANENSYFEIIDNFQLLQNMFEMTISLIRSNELLRIRL